MRFSPANAKLRKLYSVRSLAKYLKGGKKIYSFDILSGHSCPYANECLAKVHEDENGKRKLTDGPNTVFRCFSASQEVIYPAVYDMRKANLDSLRGKSWLAIARDLITNIPDNAGIVRLHVGGDFINQAYFDAWVAVATACPDILFYGYTKSLPYWVNRIATVPNNLILTASRGGRMDHMISQYNLRSAKVVLSVSEARKLGLPIDHNDSHAAVPANRYNDFALLIHGIQPAKSKSGAAIQKLKKKGVDFSYTR